MRGLQIFRVITWSLIALLGAWLAVFSGLLPFGESNRDGSSRDGTPAIGKPFELVSHEGKTVNNAVLMGKPYLAFFGFTHCPDICPTTLFELTGLMKELGPKADQLNVVFITVDPERDTRELLSAYMTAFDPRIIALRGSPERTDQAVKAFAAFAKKVPTDGGSYTMDHTAGVYRMDAEGRFKGTLDMHEPQDVRLRKVQDLIEG
jgi:protein SCO1